MDHGAGAALEPPSQFYRIRDVTHFKEIPLGDGSRNAERFDRLDVTFVSPYIGEMVFRDDAKRTSLGLIVLPAVCGIGSPNTHLIELKRLGRH